jgi:hypothetical protein
MTLKWKLNSVCLETVLILAQDRCTVCAECTTGSKIILDAPDGILGHVGHVESCFGPFEDGVSVSARYVPGLRQTYQMVRNCFGRSQWYSLVMRLKWKLVSVYSKIVLT